MSLSELTHATVEQVAKAIADLKKEYELALGRNMVEILYPARDKLVKENAKCRQKFAIRRKKLERYRDALLAEGPGE